MGGASDEADTPLLCRKETAHANRNGPSRYAKTDMEAEQKIDIPHPACVHHRPAAAYPLLGRLEDETQPPRSRARDDGSQNTGKPEANRDVAVMAAGMHHAARLRSPALLCRTVRGGRFFDRQSAGVDTSALDRPRPPRLQLGHAPRAGCSGALVPAEQPSPLQKRVARGNR